MRTPTTLPARTDAADETTPIVDALEIRPRRRQRAAPLVHRRRQRVHLFERARIDGEAEAYFGGELVQAPPDKVDEIDKCGVIDELCSWVGGLKRWRANPPLPVTVECRLAVFQPARKRERRLLTRREHRLPCARCLG